MPEILESVINLVFPKEQHIRELEDLTAQDLQSRLPKPTNIQDKTLSLFDYKHPDVRQIVWEIKYKKNKRLAFMCAELLAEELLDYLYEKRELYPHTKFILLPVPTSDKRKKQRGYNQTELLAGYIKKMIPALCYCCETLRRDVDRPSQTKRNYADRQKNVCGCFSVLGPQKITNNIVILLDDVTTTGATLEEIEKQISKHGPQEILRVTVAH